jgi:hypothetical protein
VLKKLGWKVYNKFVDFFRVRSIIVDIVDIAGLESKDIHFLYDKNSLYYLKDYLYNDFAVDYFE